MQENAVYLVVFGFNFTSDWLRGWCMFSGPITEQALPYSFL